jgi:exodeoxyribonuclease V alpha subunit
VLVGQKKAVAIAVRNVSGRRRWSKLSEWIGTVGPGPVRSRATARHPLTIAFTMPT